MVDACRSSGGADSGLFCRLGDAACGNEDCKSGTGCVRHTDLYVAADFCYRSVVYRTDGVCQHTEAGQEGGAGIALGGSSLHREEYLWEIQKAQPGRKSAADDLQIWDETVGARYLSFFPCCCAL